MYCDLCNTEFAKAEIGNRHPGIEVVIDDHRFELGISFYRRIRSRRRRTNSVKESYLCNRCQKRIIAEAMVAERIVLKSGLRSSFRKKKKIKKAKKKETEKIKSRLDILDI